MASAGGIRAGKAFVELYMKDKKIAAGFKRVGTWAKKMGNHFKAAGRKIFMVGAALSLVLGIATRTFISFSDQMQVVKAVTSSTSEEFEKLNDRAKKLGRTTSFTASEVAAGMASLGRAGFSNTEILDSIDSILDLARGTGTELGRTGEIAANSMRAFRLEATKTTYVADLLTKTANSSAQVLDDLGESLKYVAPFAYDAGASLRDTLAALGTLANIGIKGSMAGTALARAYKNVTKTKIAKYLESIGVKTKDSNNNLLKMSDILLDLGRKTKNMGTADKLAAFDKIFGRGAVAASGLSSGGTLTNFQKILKAVNGTAKKTAQIMDGALGGAWRRFTSAVEGVAIGIAESLAPELSRVGKKITAIANKITDWIKKNKKLVLSMAKGVLALLAIGAALSIVGSALVAIGFAAHGLGGLITLATTFAGILGAVKIAIVGAFVALKGVALASVPGILMAIFNPLTLTVVAIGFVAAVLMKTTGAWDNYKKVAKDAISIIKTDFSNAYGGIVAALKAGEIKAAWKIVCAFISLEWTRVWSACKETWLIVSNFFENGYNLLTTDMVSAFLGASHGIKRAWMAVGQFFEKLWLGIKAGAVNAWNYSLRLMNKMPGVNFKVGQNINYSAESAKLDSKHTIAIQKEKDNYAADKQTNKELYLAQKKQNQIDLNKGINASSDALRKAATELADAVKEAKKAAQKAAAAKTAANKSKKQKSKASVWNQAQAQLGKVSSVGSFSGAAVAANGGVIKNLQEKIVSISEKIEQHTEKIANAPKTYLGFTQ